MDNSRDAPVPETSASSQSLSVHVCRCRKAMPYVAVVGSGLFIASYVNPGFLSAVFCKKAAIAQNTLFLAAHVGAGVTLYDRLPKADENWKSVAIASVGSLLFNHGSLLLVGVVKDIVPDNKAVRLLAGSMTMAAIYFTGREFLNIVSQ